MTVALNPMKSPGPIQSDIAPKINANKKYEFVWITDGQGWLSAKNKLEEAYSIIPRVYNLTTLPSFVEELKKMA